jgi:hypothetical protein
MEISLITTKSMSKKELKMNHYVLKKMARIHCARGPKRCKICKEYANDKRWALLIVNPDKNPMAARPMIELEVDGDMVFLPYDVIGYYDDIKTAMEYANEKSLKVQVLNED